MFCLVVHLFSREDNSQIFLWIKKKFSSTTYFLTSWQIYDCSQKLKQKKVFKIGIIDGRNLFWHWTVKENETGSSSQHVFEIYIPVDLIYSTETCLKECNGVPTNLPTVLTVVNPKQVHQHLVQFFRSCLKKGCWMTAQVRRRRNWTPGCAARATTHHPGI